MYNGWWLEKVMLSVSVFMESSVRIPDKAKRAGQYSSSKGALAVVLFRAIRVSTRRTYPAYQENNDEVSWLGGLAIQRT